MEPHTQTVWGSICIGTANVQPMSPSQGQLRRPPAFVAPDWASAIEDLNPGLELTAGDAADGMVCFRCGARGSQLRPARPRRPRDGVVLLVEANPARVLCDSCCAPERAEVDRVLDTERRLPPKLGPELPAVCLQSVRRWAMGAVPAPTGKADDAYELRVLWASEWPLPVGA